MRNRKRRRKHRRNDQERSETKLDYSVNQLNYTNMLKDIQPPYNGPSSFLKEMELLKDNKEFVFYLRNTDEYISALRKMGYDLNSAVTKIECPYLEICGGEISHPYGREETTNCPKFKDWASMVEFILKSRRIRKNAELILQATEEKKEPKETGEIPEGLEEYAEKCAFPHVIELGDGKEFFVRGLSRRDYLAAKFLQAIVSNEMIGLDNGFETIVRKAFVIADEFLKQSKEIVIK